MDWPCYVSVQTHPCISFSRCQAAVFGCGKKHPSSSYCGLGCGWAGAALRAQVFTPRLKYSWEKKCCLLIVSKLTGIVSSQTCDSRISFYHIIFKVFIIVLTRGLAYAGDTIAIVLEEWWMIFFFFLRGKVSCNSNLNPFLLLVAGTSTGATCWSNQPKKRRGVSCWTE